MYIKEARSQLQETSDFVKMMAAPIYNSSLNQSSSSGFEDEQDTAEEDDGDDPTIQKARKRKLRLQAISDYLNLLSAFLYMANYYIVLPSANKYAERLGVDASQSGLIVGMTPIAALCSTILYSWWTSHSYKAALVFASACSIIGNLCYAAGLPLQSYAVVLVGRLVNGFGSARSINRRYIADRFNSRQRTAASAAFVTAGALGMSAGPALAALTEFAVNKYHPPTISDNNADNRNDASTNLFWQVENAPGWIMCGLWTVYVIALLLCFQDPPRRRHKQQQQKEMDDMKRHEQEFESSRSTNRHVAFADDAETQQEQQRSISAHNMQQRSTTMESAMSTHHRLLVLYHEYIAVEITIAVYFVLKLVSEVLKTKFGR